MNVRHVEARWVTLAVEPGRRCSRPLVAIIEVHGPGGDEGGDGGDLELRSVDRPGAPAGRQLRGWSRRCIAPAGAREPGFSRGEM
jgi:hypothetical protein